MSLDSLKRQIEAWQAETFPAGTAASCAEHLTREAQELRRELWDLYAPRPADEVNPDGVAEELADVFFLLVAVADRQGLDLARAVRRKLTVNKARTWQAPDSTGVIEHQGES